MAGGIDGGGYEHEGGGYGDSGGDAVDSPDDLKTPEDIAKYDRDGDKKVSKEEFELGPIKAGQDNPPPG